MKLFTLPIIKLNYEQITKNKKNHKTLMSIVIFVKESFSACRLAIKRIPYIIHIGSTTVRLHRVRRIHVNSYPSRGKNFRFCCCFTFRFDCTVDAETKFRGSGSSYVSDGNWSSCCNTIAVVPASIIIILSNTVVSSTRVRAVAPREHTDKLFRPEVPV
jgi:hypothetical protein